MESNLASVVQIPVHLGGQKIEWILHSVYPQYTLAQWIFQLKKQQILHKEKPLRAQYRLPAGESVHIMEFPQKISALKTKSVQIPIIFESSEILVVHKPVGVIVHPTHQTPKGQTLVEILGAQYGELHLVHRLDATTSGIIVLTKSARIQAKWENILSSPQTQKIYQALVWGNPIDQCISLSLARDKKGKAVVDPSGASAVSNLRVLERLGEASKVEVIIETGRFHQIRVHLASIGYPIIGDSMYGLNTKKDREFKAKRIYLHALKLIGPNFDFAAPLPQAFETMLQRLK